jgi:hypothetical protein
MIRRHGPTEAAGGSSASAAAILPAKAETAATEPPLAGITPVHDNREAARRLVAAQLEVEELRRRVTALEAEVRDLRVYAPPRPPKDWLGIRQAAHKAGSSTSLIYKLARLGLVRTIKLRGIIFVDPSSLRARRDDGDASRGREAGEDRARARPRSWEKRCTKRYIF